MPHVMYSTRINTAIAHVWKIWGKKSIVMTVEINLTQGDEDLENIRNSRKKSCFRLYSSVSFTKDE